MGRRQVKSRQVKSRQVKRMGGLNSHRFGRIALVVGSSRHPTAEGAWCRLRWRVSIVLAGVEHGRCGLFWRVWTALAGSLRGSWMLQHLSAHRAAQQHTHSVLISSCSCADGACTPMWPFLAYTAWRCLNWLLCATYVISRAPIHVRRETREIAWGTMGGSTDRCPMCHEHLIHGRMHRPDLEP